MILQIQIPDPLNNPVTDTALKATPDNGLGYGLALATPYIFLIVLVILAVAFYRHQLAQEAKREAAAAQERKDAKAERAQKEEREEKQRQEREEKEAKSRKEFAATLVSSVKDVGDQFAEELKKTRSEIHDLANQQRAEAATLHNILNGHDRRLLILELRPNGTQPGPDNSA